VTRKYSQYFEHCDGFVWDASQRMVQTLDKADPVDFGLMLGDEDLLQAVFAAGLVFTSIDYFAGRYIVPRGAMYEWPLLPKTMDPHLWARIVAWGSLFYKDNAVVIKQFLVEDHFIRKLKTTLAWRSILPRVRGWKSISWSFFDMVSAA